MSLPTEPTILTHEREQLAYLLTEAAEIEHGLMCCYLYAAYSLRQGEAEGLTAPEAEALARWRATMVDVAIDEMLHLALVSNLLTAIGSAPHFQRQNFPVSPGYHPAGVVVALAPFDDATLDHFVYLERPEGIEEKDGAGFEAPTVYHREARGDRLVPSAQDYATVGHLYRGIRAGFESLTEKLGEAALFVGDPRAQVGSDIAPIDGILPVVDLASARRAIDLIVEQGEGATGHSERSHYARFSAIRDELRTLRAAHPGFEPAHPAARNPVMRKPPEPHGKVWVDASPAASVLDLGNAVYAFALRCLARAFGQCEDPPASRARLVNASFAAMRELAPLMHALAQLPACAGAETPHAGLTFTMQRSTVSFAQQRAAWAILVERAGEIATAAAKLDGAASSLGARVQSTFGGLARELAAATPTASAAGQAVVSLPIAPAAPAAPAAAAAAPSSPIEEAESESIKLRFEGKRCIHSRQCVLGAPTVFLANVQGPWLHPETIPADRLVAIAESCPSGAITYERKDGGPAEPPPPVNVARIRENGPLALHAELEIEGPRGGSMFRATLCRCGASKNKPYCDGSHAAVPFVASGEPPTEPTDPLPTRGGRLRVLPTKDGPLMVDGNLEICAGTGRTVKRVTSARLCRCGGSSKKPFCDGTHARIGFRSGDD